ncbi:helix-turn-helix domain-containing protein [Alicyclobacillus fodiniaquatilis]|uniref:Helix-turn-helix domain-containing protein n=1 Tax=Alicyclobacillus fodiniaquatilis TaxID=1661150 RepID=A0ABW4JB50_9BACL
MPNNDHLTLKEAAQHFGVSVQTIRRWIKDGKLEAELQDSPYGRQYFIPAYQIKTAAEVQDVVKVDRTVDMASLVRVMDQYLNERDQSLLDVLQSVQSDIRESIQRHEQREEELIKEIRVAREENKELRDFIDNRLEEQERKTEERDAKLTDALRLMEEIRSLQEQASALESQQSKEESKRRPWWRFGR